MQKMFITINAVVDVNMDDYDGVCEKTPEAVADFIYRQALIDSSTLDYVLENDFTVTVEAVTDDDDQITEFDELLERQVADREEVMGGSVDGDY